MWSLTIERARNGWVIRIPPEDDDHAETIEVVEDDEQEGVKGAISLLSYVAEHFDLEGSRHDAKRLFIGYKPGNKHHDWHPEPCAECECGCDPDQSDNGGGATAEE